MGNFLKPSLCASLDVLGFQDEILRAYDEKRERKLLREVEETLKSAADHLEEIHARNPQILTLKFFTDNIVIGYLYVTPSPISGLDHLCELLADFQLSMACKGLFIRGGISVGTLASDERMVFGNCLIEAHKLEAKWARNPRVILDKCFEKQNGFDVNMSVSRLMRDVDDFLFVNYLSALIELKSTAPPPFSRLNEERLQIHKNQVERLLEEKRHDPHVWSKYFWVANYHDAFCDQVQRKQYKINESLLRAHPVSLGNTVAASNSTSGLSAANS